MRYAACVVFWLKRKPEKRFVYRIWSDTLKCAKNVTEKSIKIFLFPDIFDQAALGYYVLKLLISTKFVAISVVKLFSTCKCIDSGFYYNRTFELYKYHFRAYQSIQIFYKITILTTKDIYRSKKKMSSNQELSYKAGEATGQVQVHTTQKDIFRIILCIPTQTLESYRMFIKNGKVIRYQVHSGRIMHFRYYFLTYKKKLFKKSSKLWPNIF